MTAQEARMFLEIIATNMLGNSASVNDEKLRGLMLREYDALDTAIDALEKQSKLERVIERLEEEKSNLTTWAEDEAYKLAINKAIEIIKEELM